MTDEQISVEDMKTITFEGKEYELPVWVKWVAKDAHGCVYAFDLKPKPCFYEHVWRESTPYPFGKRGIKIDEKASWNKAIIEV
jgi:hypothetical protein